MARKRSRSRQFKKSSRVIDMDQARRQRLEKREAQRSEAKHEVTASDERRLRRKRALRKKQGVRRLFVLIVVVFVLAVLSASVFNIVKLKKEQNAALEKQQELKDKQEQLKEEVKNAGNEKDIEDLAREKLKLAKPGETIYIPDAEEN